MHFCNKCDNMYYIRISSDEKNLDKQHTLIYYCRNCGNEDENLTNDNICVSKTQIKRSEQKFNHIINEYTKLDPTLPRINTIKCPNTNCSSNKDKGDREVIYIRYDDVNQLYIYLCAKCDTIWKTDSNV
jgi:DNA-directed RNA polymerase subunit M/transcription elongation factor TFIIS